MAPARKNSLFAGNDGAAWDWAVLASLIETCRLNGAYPHEYLTWTLDAICADYKQSRINDLLPWSYADRKRQDIDQAAWLRGAAAGIHPPSPACPCPWPAPDAMRCPPSPQQAV